MTRKRIYVAGPYSCKGRCEPLGIDLTNMARGITACVTLLNFGFAPFCPWLDFLYVLVPGGEQLEREDFYEYSMAWLEAADAVYVIELKQESVGTIAEIKRAESLGIPVYYKLADLLEAL